MNRRELITGLVSLVAAPAIVRAGSLMPVRSMPFESAYGLIAEDINAIQDRIICYTTPPGGFPPVERLRITSDYRLLFNNGEDLC